MVNVLIGGWDEKDGPSLYFIDYLSCMARVNRASHGYGGYFLPGILDHYFKPNLTEQEGIGIAKKCIEEVQTRFILSQAEFSVKIVDKNGIRILDINSL